MTDERAHGWFERGVAAGRDLLDGGPWEVSILNGTGGGNFGSGVARLRSETDLAIVKVTRRNDAAPSEPDYWRRELDVYRSSWLVDRLPDGLEIPACRATLVTDDAAIVVMESVPFDHIDRRPTDWFRRLADRLGRLAAAPLDDVPRWACRGFVATELGHVLDAAPTMLAAPLPEIAERVHEWRELLHRLVDVAPRLLARLDAAPAAFQHIDASARNAAGNLDRMTLIDWAYGGVAPVGTDAAAIVVVTAAFGDVRPSRVEDLHQLVTEGYRTGLRLGGHHLADDENADELAAIIAILITLRWTRFLTQLQDLGDRFVEVVEAVSGRPVRELAATWAAISRLVLPRAQAALADV